MLQHHGGAGHCVRHLLPNVRHRFTFNSQTVTFLPKPSQNEASEPRNWERWFHTPSSPKHRVKPNQNQVIVTEAERSDAVVWQHKTLFCLNYTLIWRAELSEPRAYARQMFVYRSCFFIMAFPASLDKSCLGKNRSSVQPALQWRFTHTRRRLTHSNPSLPLHLCIIILPTNDADFNKTATVSRDSGVKVQFKRSAWTSIKQAFLLHKSAALFEAGKHAERGWRGQIQPPVGFASAGGSFYTRFSLRPISRWQFWL